MTKRQLRAFNKLDDERKELVVKLLDNETPLKAYWIAQVTDIANAVNDAIKEFYGNRFDGIAQYALEREKNMNITYEVKFIEDRCLFDRFVLCFNKTFSLPNASYMKWDGMLKLGIESVNITKIEQSEPRRKGYKISIPTLHLDLFN